jgi:hypothetical protein
VLVVELLALPPEGLDHEATERADNFSQLGLSGNHRRGGGGGKEDVSRGAVDLGLGLGLGRTPAYLAAGHDHEGLAIEQTRRPVGHR